MADLVAAHPQLGAEGVALLGPGVAAARRTTPGGGGPGPVAEQRERFRARLAADAARVG
jgi:argininosuccinate lyase